MSEVANLETSMNSATAPAFVRTIKDRCRVCYTCVRECPAKAIKISDGQAQIIHEDCIACGNCVTICSQHAKEAVDTVPEVRDLLASGRRVAACIAPSFPAEFTEYDHRTLVGMIRRLGFDLVTEVAFGADLVAAEYHRLLAEHPEERFIATTCPAIIGYVERYHPALIKHLAPIVSPMLAIGRTLKKIHGDDLALVFIGPCIAKKVEVKDELTEGVFDAAITFAELRRLFITDNLPFTGILPSDFDPPHPGLGALFPVSRGLLQAADIKEDLLTGEVIAASGINQFKTAIHDFETGNLDARLLELLACKGCIMGPGMTSKEPMFHRRSRVSKYVRQHVHGVTEGNRAHEIACFDGVDLGRAFEADDHRAPEPTEDELQTILRSIGKERESDELNCGACGYHSCRAHARAIFMGRAEKEMCLPFIIDRLKSTVHELKDSNQRLASTQEALLQSEKLASMGQLAAGVAHEVNNPLGIVLMYSHMLLDEADKQSPVYSDLHMIAEQATRCKKIVAGLLDFARENRVLLQPCDVRQLVNRAVLSVPAPGTVEISLRFDLRDPVCELDEDQMIQVLTNLISNAFDAMPEGGKLLIHLRDEEEQVVFSITDTGHGIAEENMGKLFEPFFTTKKMGKGTGLGLPVSYGIVKMHRGNIAVQSNANAEKGPTGTSFTITLPRHGRKE